jgi:PucR family transcriptional regulator, purine catabolism regulatory protein
VPSLEQLWRAVFPQARLHAPGGNGLDRRVAWVRVLRARVPAFDALEADELAIVPLAVLDSLRSLALEPASVIEAVAEARGCAILLVGVDPASGETLDGILRRAGQLDLPVLALADADIGALERSAIAYVVAGQAELERRVADLETELERAALAEAGMDTLAGVIARFLARPVAIEGADGAVLAAHAPAGGSVDAGAVGVYLQRRRGAALRQALPTAGGETGARRRARSAGALVLLGGNPPSELDRLAARRVSGLLALELGRGPAVDAQVVGGPERLPSGGPPWVVLVARQLEGAGRGTLEERERLRQQVRRAEPASRLALRGDAASLELRLVAAPSDDDPRGLALASRIARRIDRPLALSRPFSDAGQRAQMEAEARQTLEAAELLPETERERLTAADGTLVARADLAPAYLLLGALRDISDGPRQARALLGPLLTGRPRHDAQTLATLRALLDHAGLAEAAQALGIHRNTLAYRLARMEQRSGWRLSDPGLRFALAMAVRLVQSAQNDATDSIPGGNSRASRRA